MILRSTTALLPPLAAVLHLSAAPPPVVLVLASAPDVSHCRYACGPHGTCRPGSSSSPDSYECVCDLGWSGDDCSVPYVQCDDGKRRCYNNSECRRNEKPDPVTGEYGYRCDCSLAYGVSAFAGHECENSATQICEISTPLSRHAFCTNGGKCRAYVLPGEEHEGCDCPPDFEGGHCQYLKGTAPAEELERSNPRAYEESHEERQGGHIGAGGIAAIIIFILGVFAAAVYGGWRIYREREGIEKNYIEGLAEDHIEGEGDKEGGYSLKGRKEVELAGAGTESTVAASMDLDPDGSSTMRPKGGGADEDAFDEEAQPAEEARNGGEVI